jgi:arsenate reductase
MIKPKVLFICSGNSCRTQMAEGFLRRMGGDRFEPFSAGADSSAGLDPDAVAAMRDAGIDISDHRPKKVDPFMRERMSYVVTLCEREIEHSCPIFPGAIWRLKWPIEDPAMAKDPEEHWRMVCRARDELQRRVIEFIQANT